MRRSCVRSRYSRRTRRDCRHRVPVGDRVLAADPGGGDRVTDIVNVDTLVETISRPLQLMVGVLNDEACADALAPFVGSDVQ